MKGQRMRIYDAISSGGKITGRPKGRAQPPRLTCCPICGTEFVAAEADSRQMELFPDPPYVEPDPFEHVSGE